jgi:C-terminal processing protease CtpA/Prc
LKNRITLKKERTLILNIRFKFILLFALFFGVQNIDFGQELRYPNSPNQSDLLSLYALYEANGGPLIPFNYEVKYPPKALKWDLFVLESVLKEAKTGLANRGGDVLDSTFLSANEKASDSLTYLEFAREVAKIFNAAGCGHSGLGHHTEYYNYRYENMKFFPLDLYVIGDRYFVKTNHSFDIRIRPYDEILTINGLTPATISQALRKHMSADCFSAEHGTSLIQNYFRMAFSNFIGNPNVFNLKMKSHAQQNEFLVDLKAYNLISIKASETKKKRPQKKYKTLELEIDKPKNTAVYTIRSFRNEAINQNGQEFYAFTDSVFKELNEQNITNIIIDIRGNAGGWTANGAHLFSYFINEPQPYINQVETKKIDNYSFEPLITSQPGYLDTFQFAMQENALQRWVNYPSLNVSPAKQNKFSGTCYILIDDMSFSCSAVFSALMKNHTSAIFVGEETGGCQSRTFGMVMGIRLPYTGLMVHFATAQYDLNVKNKLETKGVVPDFEVLNSIETYKNGLDPQMIFTINLIERGK